MKIIQLCLLCCLRQSNQDGIEMDWSLVDRDGRKVAPIEPSWDWKPWYKNVAKLNPTCADRAKLGLKSESGTR